jgi:hypothetical protein
MMPEPEARQGADTSRDRIAQCGSTEIHRTHWYVAPGPLDDEPGFCAGLDGTEVGR